MNIRLRTLLPAALLWASTAGATIVQSLSLDEMAAKADVVVHGVVMAQSAAWNDTRTRIYTVTEVKVRDRLKGKGPPDIVIRQLGGTVDGITQAIVGNAALRPGEEVVLFLNHDPSKGLHYVLGMAQGKYAVERGEKGAVVRHDVAGLALARIEDGRLSALKTGGPSESALSLEAFKASIRQALAAAGR